MGHQDALIAMDAGNRNRCPLRDRVRRRVRPARLKSDRVDAVANKDHVAILDQGVEAWNRWRAGHAELEPDLSSANLARRFLPCINFRRDKHPPETSET